MEGILIIGFLAVSFLLYSLGRALDAHEACLKEISKNIEKISSDLREINNNIKTK